MSIDVRPADDSEQWNRLVRRSETTTPFHLAEALDVFAQESNMSLDRLVGYKGQEPVGIFPVFTRQMGPFTAVFSPPPDLKVHYLGPALIVNQDLKQRRHELRHTRFIDAALEWVQRTYDPSYSLVRTAPRYDDVRPFLWNDYGATPRYTYVVDLTRDPEDLLAAFSSDARRNVTAEYDLPYTIDEGGPDDIAEVLQEVRALHAKQDEPFPIDAAFVTELYDALPDGAVRPLVCRSDGEFVGGFVNLELEGRSMCWLGVTDREVDLPATDLLDWAYIQDAADRGGVSYDLMGANKRRLSRYKAKFAPELVPYFKAENGALHMTIAKKIYSRLR